MVQHADISHASLITATKLDDLATPDDNTDLNASTTRHGLLRKLDNTATNFLNGQGGWTVPAGSGGVTASENFVTGDVTMTNANTVYDGPSLSLAAGTWVLTGRINVLVNDATGSYVNARLINNATVEDEASGFGLQFVMLSLPVFATVVLGGTTTVKISAIANGAGNTIRATNNTNGTTNKASHLLALKIA